MDALRDRHKMLGVLLTDQAILAGLGVAWASEVCAAAGVLPQLHAAAQNLDALAPALAAVRERVQAAYTAHLQALYAACTGDALLCFCRGWFQNLYDIRIMRAFKVGVPISMNGRVFWTLPL